MTLFKCTTLDKIAKEKCKQKRGVLSSGDVLIGSRNGKEPREETEKQWPETGRKSRECGHGSK